MHTVNSLRRLVFLTILDTRFWILSDLFSFPLTSQAAQRYFMGDMDIAVTHRTHLDAGQIAKLLGNLAPPPVSSVYDLMFSYRQEFEAVLVTDISDSVAAHGVTWIGANLNVFFDRDCLRHGKRYDMAFMMAVAKTRTVVPLISLGKCERAGQKESYCFSYFVRARAYYSDTRRTGRHEGA